MRNRFVARMSEYKNFSDVDKHRRTIEFLAAQSDPISQEKLIRELGFKDIDDYIEIQNQVKASRTRLLKKYDINTDSELNDFEGVLKNAVIENNNLAKARGDWDNLCTHCFFNNCNNCNGSNSPTGEGKDSSRPDGGGGDCLKKKLECLDRASRQKMSDAQNANGALILAISTCVGSGAAAGTSVAGSTFFAGPYAVLAGIVTGGVSGGACLAGVYLVYQSAMENAELKYLETKDKCYSQYNC